LMAEESNHTGQHEHSDVSVRGIVWSLIILAGCGIVLHFTMQGLWWLFGETVAPKDPVSAWSGPRELPPSPRLQITPRADLEVYLKRERERLNSYGVDGETGAVHIPIERAMELVVQRGLPSRKTTPPSAPGPPPHDATGGAPVGAGRSAASPQGSQSHVP
jgi:hypothetical protein